MSFYFLFFVVALNLIVWFLSLNFVDDIAFLVLMSKGQIESHQCHCFPEYYGNI